MQCHPYYELLPTKYELIFFFLTFSLSDLLFPPFAVYHRLRIARMWAFSTASRRLRTLSF